MSTSARQDCHDLSRAERLLDLLQLLRRHRHPVTGARIASELGVSLRTLYRDIATLQSQGAMIDGEPGIGYVLRPGFTLPPLMFSEDEVEALVLGSRWVAGRGNVRLALAAKNALGKIASVLSSQSVDALHASPLLAGPEVKQGIAGDNLDVIRESIRNEHKLQISYLDLKGAKSVRIVWPIAVGFFEDAQVLVAWCELRQAFRHFRLDRIAGLIPTDLRYPRWRIALLQEWRNSSEIAEQ
jgi:predicted DNA-binding transcriptional regulator YafY